MSLLKLYEDLKVLNNQVNEQEQDLAPPTELCSSPSSSPFPILNSFKSFLVFLSALLNSCFF